MNSENMKAVLKAMPGTQYQLRDKSGLSLSTISRLVRAAQRAGKAHITKFLPRGAEGPPQAVYKRGKGDDAQRPVPKDLRQLDQRKRLPVKRDVAVSALFGDHQPLSVR